MYNTTVTINCSIPPKTEAAKQQHKHVIGNQYAIQSLAPTF